MRYCKKCNSKMILRVSNYDTFQSNYIWGCSTFPICMNTENTILKPITNYIQVNSLKELRPNDFISDAIRHKAICDNFDYDHSFEQKDFIDLHFLLGFENQSDFFFWVASQQKVIKHSVHHYLPVGSPYYFLFNSLTNSIDNIFGSAIAIISNEQNEKIQSAIIGWTEYFKIESEKKLNKKNEQNKIINEQHNAAQLKKSEKASKDIFNSIRRQDYNAIIALRKKGADLNYISKSGINSIEYAKTFNDEKLIESLTCIITEKL